MRQGKLTREEADEHPQRSIITRALGPESEVEVDRITRARARRRRLPDLQRRADVDGPRGPRRRDPAGRSPTSTRRRARADQGGQRRRRPRQHHGGPLPRSRRSVSAAEGATADERTMTGAAAPTTAEVRAAVAAAPPAPPPHARRRAPSASPPRTPSRPAGRPAGGAQALRRAAARCSCWSIVLVPILGGGYLATQAVFFLGVASNGSVTVFQGLPYDLPFGLHLYTSAYVTGLTPAQLPAPRRRAAARPQAALARRRVRPRPPARARTSWPPVERAQPRAAGARPGVAAGRRRLRGDLPLAQAAARRPARHQRDLQRLADLRRAVPGAVRRRAPGDPLLAAQRRPLPVPARRAAGQLRPGRDLPDQRHAGPPAGAVVRHRPGALRGDDRRVPRLPGPRALPLRDRPGGHRPAAAAAVVRAGQRRLPADPDRLAVGPAGRVLQDRHRRLPGQLPARHAAADGHRRAAGSSD